MTGIVDSVKCDDLIKLDLLKDLLGDKQASQINFNLLLEDNGNYLLEDGGFILIETATP